MKKSKFIYNFLIHTFFTLVVFTNASLAQDANKQQLLFVESEELCNNKPDEALKIGKLLLKSSSSDNENAKINLLLAKIYKVKGDYNNVLIHLFEASKNPKNIDLRDEIEINIRKSEILRILYLDNPSKKYLDDASTKIIKIKDSKTQNFLKASIVLEKAMMYLERQNSKDALNLIQKEEINFSNTLQENIDLNKWYIITKGKIYSGLGNYDKAYYYFNQLDIILKKDKNIDKLAEIDYLNGSSTVFFHKKEYQKAIDLSLKSLKSANEIDNFYLTEIINKNLMLNYLAINNAVDYKSYNADFLKTRTEFENLEQDAINTAHNLITQEFDNKYEVKRKSFNNKLYLFLIAFFIILLVCFLFWYKQFSKKKRLNEIINYLEITRKNSIIDNAEKIEVKEAKEINKKIVIPIETENALLNKLKRFESSSRFTNKEMSLAVLAGQLDTNTKYLSEIINNHYNMNFNSYINKLRINFIVSKLKSDANFINYKISYLAETCGFSSHSSFATVFKSITGITPITFIELLKKEKEESLTSNSDYNDI